MKWGKWCVIGLAAVVAAGCGNLGGSAVKDPVLADPELRVDPKDENARGFSGILHGFRPMASVMLVTTGNTVPPNQVFCKYDASTKFYLDGRPMTLDQVRQYMPVSIKGRVAGDHFQIEVAKFSSVLPANVKPAPETSPGK